MATFNAGGPGMGASIDGSDPVPCDLEITREMIDVSSGLPTRKPDPSWELVDKKGHYHAFTNDGKLPTLSEETVMKPCMGGCGNYECEGTPTVRYRCRICKKKIRPSWISDYDSLNKQIPGRLDWSVAIRNAPLPPPGEGQEVSVKVTSQGVTYFGIGQPYGVTIRGDSGRVVTDYTVQGASELGRRGAAQT